MNNDVVIHVRVDDDTARGYASARHGANKTASDIVGEMKRVGPKIGDGLGDGMLSGLKGTLPSFAQFGGVMGVIMAPTLGAAVAAGVMGGAGGLGIIGGLMLAAKDPAVQAAGAELKDSIGKDLQGAATSFIPVALQSIGKVKTAFKAILPDIRSIFDDSSKFVAPLLDGILSGGTKIVSSIKHLVQGAQPVFESFGRAFDDIGTAVQHVFDSLADNGAEGASAVDDLVGSLTKMVEVTGYAINGLAEMKGKADSLDDSIDKQRYSLEDNVSWLDLTADGYKKGSVAADLYRQGLIGAAGSSNDYAAYLKKQKAAQDAATGSTEKQTSALQDLAAEMQAQTDPLFAMIKGQRDVAKAQNNYNDALKKHGPRSAEAKEALQDLGQAAFALNSKVGGAAGGFNGKLTPAMRTALRNAGLTKGQMNRLEDSLRDAARAAHAWEGTFRQTYLVTRKENISYAGNSVTGARASGGIVGAASGGIRGNMTWTGEHGPELLELPPGTRVHSNPDSMRMAAAGGRGGSSDVTLRFARDADGPIARAVMQGLRALIRAEGGNVQTVLGT
jgi:hypothetical protein